MTAKTLKMRHSNATGYSDIVVGDNGIDTDGALQTIVETLILCDRTADKSDELPFGQTSRRGYWADVLQRSGFKLGSRMWLLANAKATATNRRRARDYAKEAIKPLVDLGVVLRAEVESVQLRRDDVIAIEVRLLEPSNPAPQWVSYWVDVDFATLGSAT